MELSSPKLKKLLFLGEPLRVFHHCFFRGFHFSPLIFTTVFRVFSLLIAFFMSPTLLLFCQVLRSCVVVPWVLRIWEGSFLILRRFLPYTPSRHLAQPSFIKAFLGAGSSSLKVPGPPTNVRNTHPAHLFVWITQCSPKGISR